ncbi:glycosyltransferase [Paludisphaera rhizosphaerae]|uniref:glycosyltransferase n=1 Tax=Paludisphaera rhizosphaerae TaxID=2711216 RepID=UPI0013E9D96B|nr:glycosyltransferase [Paludisphaera rhizosphaerae]
MKPRVVSLAPMCLDPAHDGASLRVIEVARAFRDLGHPATVIGRDFLLELAPDGGAKSSRIEARWPGRSEAVVRGLLTSGHYNEIKHTSPTWRQAVRAYLRDHDHDIVIIHMLWMIDLLSDLSAAKVIALETHNSEWRLYDRYLDQSRNPLVRRLTNTSRRRLDEVMVGLPKDVILVHISEADLLDHRERRPDLRHLLVPSGCESLPRKNAPDYSVSRKRMIFFGNLANKMNNDALGGFAEEFWPILRDVADFTVAGSNPSATVVELCRCHGWELVPDFTDEAKVDLYERSHFAILPFRYGVGSKLKMLDACGHGIPVLTTRAGNCGGLNLPPFVTVADSPEVWRRVIVDTRSFDPSWSRAADDFASAHSQTEALAPLIQEIEDRIATRAPVS